MAQGKTRGKEKKTREQVSCFGFQIQNTEPVPLFQLCGAKSHPQTLAIFMSCQG